MTLKLPAPDAYGNHWWGSAKDKATSAVFPSKRLAASQRSPDRLDVVHAGAWFVLVNAVVGCLWDGPRLRTFPTAEKAAAALEQALREHGLPRARALS